MINGLMDYAEGGRYRTSRGYWSLFLVMLLLAGCHSSRPTATVPEVPPVEAELPAPVEPPHRSYTVMNFSGEVEGVSVNGQLRLAEDSVMWLSVNKVIELGRALATPDSLFLRAPMMGRDEAIDYPALQRLTGRNITFDDLQQTVLADDASERIARMAASLGASAHLTINERRQVEYLSFPFPKTPKR